MPLVAFTIVFIVSNSLCQTPIRSLPCRDTAIELKKWELDSIGESQLYDSLQDVLIYLKKPVWLEFSNGKQFFGSDGCNGIFGNFVAYDGHIFFYDAGSQAGLCKYNSYESKIRGLQDFFRQSLAITRYSCTDSSLVIRTVYGNLFFKKNVHNGETKTTKKHEDDLDNMYKSLNQISK